MRLSPVLHKFVDVLWINPLRREAPLKRAVGKTLSAGDHRLKTVAKGACRLKPGTKRLFPLCLFTQKGIGGFVTVFVKTCNSCSDL
jgi:hypothetical protein